MEKTKDRSKFLLDFEKSFDKCSKAHTEQTKGCLILAYDLNDAKSAESACFRKGKPVDLAACLLSNMEQDPFVASLICAAYTAFANARARELEEMNSKTDKPAN